MKSIKGRSFTRLTRFTRLTKFIRASKTLQLAGKTGKGPEVGPFRKNCCDSVTDQLAAATWSKMSVTSLEGSLPARETIIITMKPQMKPGMIS